MTRPVPLQITFRGMTHSDAVSERIAYKLSKLRRLHPRILGCRVIVEALPVPGKGSRFTVHVRLTIPRGELVASHDGDAAAQHESVWVALRESMNAVARQLRAYTDRRHAHRTGPQPSMA
jgi:putative sigma-54 modulation protein